MSATITPIGGGRSPDPTERAEIKELLERLLETVSLGATSPLF